MPKGVISGDNLRRTGELIRPLPAAETLYKNVNCYLIIRVTKLHHVEWTNSCLYQVYNAMCEREKLKI